MGEATKTPRAFIIRIGVVLFVVMFFSYALFQARHLLIGPVIIVNSPQNGVAVKTPLTEVRGRAKNISSISLNDKPIFVDEGGYFKEQLLLPMGYTIMVIKADDRFGRTTQKILHIVRN